MTIAEKLVDFRTKRGYSVKDMSLKSGVGETLIKMLEKGTVTHPEIAKKIAKAYELNDDEMLELVPTIHRPGHPDYDPDKYKAEEDRYDNGVFFKERKQDMELRAYMASKSKRR